MNKYLISWNPHRAKLNKFSNWEIIAYLRDQIDNHLVMFSESWVTTENSIHRVTKVKVNTTKQFFELYFDIFTEFNVKLQLQKELK